MTDQLISFETAVLAKEKGFDIECNIQFHDKGIFQLATPENTFERPTQSLLQKWLREKHNIHIEVYCSKLEKDPSRKWRCEIKYISSPFKRTTGHYYIGRTYEEALEQGLIEALKLIP